MSDAEPLDFACEHCGKPNSCTRYSIGPWIPQAADVLVCDDCYELLRPLSPTDDG